MVTHTIKNSVTLHLENKILTQNLLMSQFILASKQASKQASSAVNAIVLGYENGFLVRERQ